ncbi:MAG TPA: DUF6328 family protein [Rhizomicrobium sp.]|jgi:hypothetical protein|nr:DUF6328 family protein [Rhizomicrobium sp.]
MAQKFQTSLDETRLLMLASQILFGFQFQTVFQDQFASFTLTMRRVDAAALLLMVVALALLLAAPSQHRLVEHGQITGRIRKAVTRYTEAALLPFSLSFGLDIYLVFTHAFGETVGIVAGAAVFGLAIALWYVAEFIFRTWFLEKTRNLDAMHDVKTDITTRTTQMLTEARIALPGAQALIGFQLAVMMTKAFGDLPEASRLLHGASLLCVALALVLLVAPAAFHRIAFAGDDTERFYRIGSNLVTVALLPLALGVSGDVYVAIERILGSGTAAIATAAGSFAMLSIFWFFYPIFLRAWLRQRAA